MQFRPTALLHAAIGAGVVGAAVLFAQPPAAPSGPTPGAPGAPAQQPAPPAAPAPADPTQDRGQPRLEEGMDPQKVMAEWMKLAKPGAPHAFLATLAGDYTTVGRMWMDPEAPPMESSGRASFKMIMGGRYLQQEYSGTMMGMPMNGMGLTGFDNHRRQYTSAWIDDMGTVLTTMTGGISKDGKVITMFGQMDEPSTKQIGKTVKWVTRIASDDKFYFESWEVETDTPIKVFEIEYSRVKK